MKLEPVVVNDYPAWSGASPGGLQHGLRAVIAVPLVRGGSLIGAIVMRSYDERTRFTIDDARLLTLFGDQAAAALLNAQAFERQRRAVEQLERVNRAKSEFVSIVSHEFRTPLTGIQGFSEMMRDEDLSLSEMKEYASDINKDALRLNRMINEMLDLDRMEAGRMTLKREQLDLGAIVSEAAARVRPNAPGHPITLVLDPAMPPISADRDRITQIVANLLSNAVKYSPTGGEIVVTTAREGDGVHLSVRDHGIGIPDDMLETIWERYSRVESDKTRGIQGTGLGLAIVQQIVTMHGGRAEGSDRALHGARREWLPREAVLDEGAARRGHASGADMSDHGAQRRAFRALARATSDQGEGPLFSERSERVARSEHLDRAERQRGSAARQAEPSCEKEGRTG